jgi:hypothetical protein
MKNIFRGRRGRAARWATGITLAGFLAGGGIALATGGGSANAAGQSSSAASTAQLNALLSASGTSASGTSASGTSVYGTAAYGTAASGANTPGTGLRKARALRRLRLLGGMYGSFTFRTKSGDETLAFERGTIESVSRSNIVVRAADGTTMTWQLVTDTVVRDHGKSSTSKLSSGERVFVGGPVVSGAHDARLVVIRSGGSTSSSAVS